jgi:hypothetical protein
MSRYLDWKEGGKEGQWKSEEGVNEEKDNCTLAIDTIGIMDGIAQAMNKCPVKITLEEVANKQKIVKSLAKLFKALKWKRLPEN